MTTAPSMQSYLEQYALISLEKHDKLEKLLGEHIYELDLDARVMRFSNGLEIPYQVLGTESDNTLTWLWAWAEEQTEVPMNLLSSAFKLKDWGEREQIREFSTPSVDLHLADGHAIALVSTQVCNASSFYRDGYEGGAAFLLLFDERIDSQPSFDRARLFQQFSELISRNELNHRNVFLSYFLMKGLYPVEKGSLIACELENGERVLAEFDETGRAFMLNGEKISD
jgi:hypothetical protein